MKSTRTRWLAAAGVASLALTMAACGSNNNTSTPPATTAAASGPFGPACSAIPADVVTAAPTVGVADAASKIPALSTLTTLVGQAGLGDTLNTTDGLTVFAPTNDAFGKVDKATLDALAADPKGALANVLKYHVVAGELTPDQLAGTHTTLEGKTLTVTGSGESFTVNGNAQVVCGNVKVKNAIVYVIDGVLIPPTS
jgi:uncharacterized surface protein with fasciclin (FAS1) repeats